VRALADSEIVSRVDRKPRVAIVHEWLTTFAGSESVLREILALFPQADLFTLVDFLSDQDRARIFGKRAKTSFIQHLPFARRRYRGYLPLMPFAIEQFDLSGYDLVISSHHAVAKGVLTGPDQLHICYCHTPIRYAWDLQHEYLAQAGFSRGLRSVIARLMLHYIRMWDIRTAAGVDYFVSNSHFIARRIRKVYGRDATVIHAPIDLTRFELRAQKEDFYLAASRMVPYKRIDLIVKAFAAMPTRRLVVIGDGPEFANIKRHAGANVTMLGFQPDSVLIDHMQRARAFIFAAQEDLGLMPLEAQACGTPVIAFRKGGALETVIGLDDAAGRAPTGIFFEAQNEAAIAEAVTLFERDGGKISPESCRRNAERFDIGRFRAAFLEFVNAARGSAGAA